MNSNHFNHRELKRRKCNFLAQFLYQIHEEEIGVHTRLAEMIIWDAWATIGRSLKGTNYREHVVPLCYLTKQTAIMFKEGRSISEVEEMWFNNYFIAFITTDEAKVLNKMDGLKFGMPKDWKIGDCPKARLKAAGIVLDTDENYDSKAG